MRGSRPSLAAPLLALLIVFAADASTKSWAEASLVPHRPVPLLGSFLQLTLGYNTGVAFGMFADGGRAVLILTGVIIAGMLVLLAPGIRRGRLPGYAYLPMGLILGGAVANFVDRLPDGRVTDFLDLGIGSSRWPTSNLSDVAITLGVVVLLWYSLREPRPAEAT